MITILCLCILIYLFVAFLLFSSFLLKGYNVSITYFDNNEKEYLEGFKKLKWCFVLCLLWPVILIKDIFIGD